MSNAWLPRGLRRIGMILITYLGLSALTSNPHNVVFAQSSEGEPSPLRVQHVVHVIGLDATKSNSSGSLVIDGTKMTFIAGDSRTEISLNSIREFSIAHDDVALIGGAKGTVVGLAPYGAGQLISVIRPAVDTLTLVYTDDNQAAHGTVLLLHKGKGDDVIRTLAKDGLVPQDYSQPGAIPTGIADRNPAKMERDKSLGRPSLEVTLPTIGVDGIPAEFPVGIYEELVAKLGSSGMFENVWRQGDNRIGPDVLILHIDIEQMKKGSARARALVPFTGASVIKVDVQLTDPAQKVLLNEQIIAAKRFRGENLDVTKILANKVKKEIAKLSDLNPRTLARE